MKRIGTKNTPVFRIVVADSRSPRDGKFIEEIGTYQPLQKGNNYTLDLERAKYWVTGLPGVVSLGLTDAEKRDLVQFLLSI